jgi:phospholipid/cholesterol/gamma-HCH transport system substrate-binding protein
MNTTQSSAATRIKVGIFTFIGLVAIVVISVVVNDKPFWWKPCQLVKINIEDATGLKTKSPIRSLGIEIGYLQSVGLSETHVSLGICITAPVEVLSSTRAYIRGEGFLGDKFVELKPVKYLSPESKAEKSGSGAPDQSRKTTPLEKFSQLLLPSAWADLQAPESVPVAAGEPPASTSKRNSRAGGREIPVGEEGQDVQHLVNRVDELVHQMSGLTDNLKTALNPEDLKRTMKQLNQTLENASKTLAPQGGLNQTAQRTLAKLEDAIEQLRDMMTRVNKGEGSVGMLLNDPTYAEDIRLAIKNVNKLLNKVGNVRFVVDVGAAELLAYNGGRAWFQLGIWPKPDRYYLLGIASDPRGKITTTTTTTLVGGVSIPVTTTVVDQTSFLLTGMLGKVFFSRLDLALGALYGDGAVSATGRLGPNGFEEMFTLRDDIYVRSTAGGIDNRVTISAQPIRGIYARAGLESIRTANNNGLPFFFGAGLTFDDEDIKLLFTLR